MSTGHDKIVSLPISRLPRLSEIADPPSSLTMRGQLPPLDATWLTVVGSRNMTEHGARAVSELLAGLQNSNVVIVSGLALGVDKAAHMAALKYNLPTVAFPGSGLDDNVLYPRTHLSLAHDILAAGGALLSEFSPQQKPAKHHFLQRNRLMVGVSSHVLIIEAAHKSGTLATARFAVDYNREVLVVPGNIFSPQSAGSNQLIKDGATPILHTNDLRDALEIKQIETLL